MYDSMLARSFGMHEKKKLGYGASVCCLLIVFCFCWLLLPYLGPLPACKSYTFSTQFFLLTFEDLLSCKLYLGSVQ